MNWECDSARPIRLDRTRKGGLRFPGLPFQGKHLGITTRCNGRKVTQRDVSGCNDRATVPSSVSGAPLRSSWARRPGGTQGAGSVGPVEVLLAHTGRCVYGDYAESRVIDHVIPLAANEADSQRNLVPACQACNLGNSDKGLTWMRERLDLPSMRQRPHLETPQWARAAKTPPSCTICAAQGHDHKSYFFLPWFLTASIAAAAASGSR
ncbi:HNH endonuclease [Streptomyces sp. SS1-1]|uniref:HNH endonuclease n=1 Tax=unclassified Streptomyces TaxID=2593676 RepID=UPI001250B449|nr:HNH endonuclease [Streptomyces sp. SS1-1]